MVTALPRPRLVSPGRRRRRRCQTFAPAHRHHCGNDIKAGQACTIKNCRRCCVTFSSDFAHKFPPQKCICRGETAADKFGAGKYLGRIQEEGSPVGSGRPKCPQALRLRPRRLSRLDNKLGSFQASLAGLRSLDARASPLGDFAAADCSIGLPPLSDRFAERGCGLSARAPSRIRRPRRPKPWTPPQRWLITQGRSLWMLCRWPTFIPTISGARPSRYPSALSRVRR